MRRRTVGWRDFLKAGTGLISAAVVMPAMRLQPDGSAQAGASQGYPHVWLCFPRILARA